MDTAIQINIGLSLLVFAYTTYSKEVSMVDRLWGLVPMAYSWLGYYLC